MSSRRDEALEVVHHLTATIGPRPATSLAEAQAAAYADGRMRRAGMKVSADLFRANTGPGPLYLLLAVLGLCSAALAPWFPLPSLLLALWGVSLTLLEALDAPQPLAATYRDSQNVVGTRAAEKTPRWRVVLLAPLDSLPPPGGLVSLAGNRRAAVVGRAVAFGLLALLVLLNLMRPTSLWWYLQMLPAAYLLLVAAPARLLEARAAAHSPDVGGAGALAVLLTVAERLPRLRAVEVWTVALGATATGSGGLRDFLGRYPFPAEQTLWVGVERIESGQLTYATREGVLRLRPADTFLLRLAESADAADPMIDAEPRPYNAAPSLAAPLHARRYRAVTLVTQARPVRAEAPGKPASAQLLEQTARLVIGMVMQLEGEER